MTVGRGSEDNAYDRGHLAGEVAARLKRHDDHFTAINGSLDKLVGELHGLKLAVQGLSDQAKSDAATLVSTAQALRNADEARRHAADRSWSPKAKAIAVIGALVGVIGLLIAAATQLT